MIGIMVGLLGIFFLVTAVRLFIGGTPDIITLGLGILLILGSIRLIVDACTKGRRRR
jgi:hypothetical protein